MGTGYGGTAASTAIRGGRRFEDNIPGLCSTFPMTKGGYFGEHGLGRSHTRNIESKNPGRTASEFAGLASKGFVSGIPIEGKGVVYRMRDGSVITHRFFSSSRDGSPVVELKVMNTAGVKSQKIHFVKKEGR